MVSNTRFNLGDLWTLQGTASENAALVKRDEGQANEADALLKQAVGHVQQAEWQFNQALRIRQKKHHDVHADCGKVLKKLEFCEAAQLRLLAALKT